ncbi:MerR family transcriptional regulator [Streptomyces sp. NPDC005435]|uniref:MerR family transcriptional regulator n=1 Tax=Streptomyces sp. NPDC005435 TaxID=3154464 RepID=UPI0034512E2D
MSDLLLPDISVKVPAEGLAIGQAAEATGVAVETLRYYEREGLLLDPTPRDGGGRRRYRAADLSWIAGLVMLRETGMSIADIRVMADLSRRDGTAEERLKLLSSHRERVIEEMRRTQRHLVAIDRKIASYKALTEGRQPQD